MGVISPPLRPRSHVEAVWEGVLDGTLAPSAPITPIAARARTSRSTSSSRAAPA